MAFPLPLPPWFRKLPTIGNNLVQNWKCQWGKKCKCAYEILKNIVENKASFTSEQVIVSYPREILSQPLEKSYSYVRELLSFPTMWQRNVSFRNFLCLLPYFWNWIKSRPGSLTLLSAIEFSSNRKFMMLSLLTFTIFNFLMAISLEVLLFEKNLVCFQKWSRLRIVPFPWVCRAWHEKWSRENPALNFWCSVSRHIKIKIETVQWIKFRIWERKEGKYSKTLANIQVTAVYLKRDIRITFLTQIYRDFYVDVRHAGA